MKLPDWYKIKGYYHLTAPLPWEAEKAAAFIKLVKSEEFVAKYAFYPLLHVNIIERKYKKIPKLEIENQVEILGNKNPKRKRAHVHFTKEGKWEKTAKVRPLHYANHSDALIFSYYAYQLQRLYEDILKKNHELNIAVTAYRKIPVDEIPKEGETSKCKGSIHFAKDVFQEIVDRVQKQGEMIVLAFDIKSFFSTLCHEHLENEWKELLNVTDLPANHYNVFKAATQFSFIYRDDLRQKKRIAGRRSGFDERKLAKIRNKNGFKAFFDSPRDFREAVKRGEIHIFKNQFRDSVTKKMIGIPQGLPISAVLANLYLLKFDQKVVGQLVENEGCFYRRYSDDIIVLCKKEQVEYVKRFIESEMETLRVKISSEKTETFLFSQNGSNIHSFKQVKEDWVPGMPLNYLGFEYYGDKILIKSANLSKFYRRMIYSIKSKCIRARKMAEKHGGKPVIFKRQLFKIYRNINLDKARSPRRKLTYVKIDIGEYRLHSNIENRPLRGNYFSYARRAAIIMNEPRIDGQIKKEKAIFNAVLQKHLKVKKEGS